VTYTCDPNTQESKAGGSQVGGQSGLHSEILFQKNQNPNIKILQMHTNLNKIL
jgi:hypothetical protein